MKTYLALFLALFLFACGEEKKDNKEESQEKEKQEETNEDGIQSDGMYKEFYENGQVRIEGMFNQKGEKSGLWRGYNKQGWLQSEILYVRGKKNGHAVVFHPNQQPKYIGEYKDDIKVGEWRFFDEDGNLTKKVEFSEE